jgi:uncharacterized alpha-E superfamily protein
MFHICILNFSSFPHKLECLILEWFVGKDYATKAIKDNFIISGEQRPELVSSSCLDSLVNIEIIRKRCTTEAWKAIEMVYGEKRRNPIHIYETCTLDADTKEASVASRVHVSYMCIGFLLFSP